MTNLGPSEFGNNTGKRGQIQVIAHCVCKDNQVVEEWLVRDNLQLAKQMGMDPTQYACEQAKKSIPKNSKFATWLATEHQRVCQQHQAVVPYPAEQRNATDTEAFITAALHNIWNARLLDTVNTLYTQSACLHASARAKLEGHGAITSFYQDILSNIADAKVTLDYVCSNSMLQDDQYVAVRWTLAGTHTGSTLWGSATHAPLLILGESQFRIVDHKVAEEWLVFDELAVMTQVERARLDNSQA